MKTIQIKDQIIGEGIPKICVPVTGKTKRKIIEESKEIKTSQADMAEWRVDYFENACDIVQILEIYKQIEDILKNIPLVFTFRTMEEGGNRQIRLQQYIKILKTIARDTSIDFIDVELKTAGEHINDIINYIHSHGSKVIVSAHDFMRTPESGSIVETLRKMQDLGADIPKVAVMPENKKDVLALLKATELMKREYADRPFITISMGEKGKISRICGEVFGSSVTFGIIKESSAPGQIPVTELKNIMKVLHNER